MSRFRFRLPGILAALLVLASLAASEAQAGGGYFVLGYGPYAGQSAGTSTAVGLDTFFGASNPGKLGAVGNRVDLGVLLFNPYRKAERSGSGTPYDFSTTSKNDIFVIPDGGYAHRIDDTWAWGVTLYGNGGLNTEYHGDTGIPGTNANPARCGNRPGNFLGGCGEVGFDLLQLIVAPTLSYSVSPKHSFGISPLLTYQQFRAYGLQAFEAFSEHGSDVSNKGYEHAFGAGVRVGWFGRPYSWLDLGAAYSSRIYMQPFDEYRGLIADGGRFDIPANFSVGLALKDEHLTFAVDIQRIYFGEIPALGNAVTDSLPPTPKGALGSKEGSGFNWRDRTNYRGVLAWHATPKLDLRFGYAYGHITQADSSAGTGGLSVLAPNPAGNITTGFSYRWKPNTELNLALGRYINGIYSGASAPPFQGPGGGGRDKISPHVNTMYLAWSRTW